MWNTPPGVQVIGFEGAVEPRFLRSDINVSLDAERSIYVNPFVSNGTLQGGVHEAGSNVLDGDGQTYWEPERDTAIDNWFIEVDLGRAVVAHRVVLRFVDKELGEPFLKFRVVASDGQCFGEEQRRCFYRVGLETQPNKDQREYDPVTDENQLVLDLGAKYWLNRIKLLMPEGSLPAYQLRISDGAFSANSEQVWTSLGERQNLSGYQRVEERFGTHEVRTRSGEQIEEIPHCFATTGREISRELCELLPESRRPPVVIEERAGPDWSNWSEIYEGSGIDFKSPRPRGYAQIEVRLVSCESLRAARIRSLQLNFEPPLVDNVLGEVWPCVCAKQTPSSSVRSSERRPC